MSAATWMANWSDADARRFWSKVALPDANGCMLWMGGRQGRGTYGVFYLGGSMRLTHRIGLLLAVGLSPADRPHAAHSCRNRHCLAPTHLRWASLQENEQDKVSQEALLKGERHPNARLTREQVLEIRSRYAAGGETHATLAADYSISRSMVGAILTGRRWRDADLILAGESQ